VEENLVSVIVIAVNWHVLVTALFYTIRYRRGKVRESKLFDDSN
jgi:hypothetical protein